MHIFIENNESLIESLNESEKYNYTPVILYNILYINKSQFKDELQKIISKKRPGLSAIKIKLLKIDSSVPGYVNSLNKYFDIVIGVGGMNKINRFFIEQTNIDFLLDPHSSEYYNKIDFIHHFNSGLNHVLCRSAFQNKISLFFTLNFTSNKVQVIKEIGRINQNIKFASKYKINLLINYIVQKPEHIKSVNELKCIYSLFDISSSKKDELLYALDYKVKNRKDSQKAISDDIKFI